MDALHSQMHSPASPRREVPVLHLFDHLSPPRPQAGQPLDDTIPHSQQPALAQSNQVQPVTPGDDKPSWVRRNPHLAVLYEGSAGRLPPPPSSNLGIADPVLFGLGRRVN
jgi:hypothetical protein